MSSNRPRSEPRAAGRSVRARTDDASTAKSIPMNLYTSELPRSLARRETDAEPDEDDPAQGVEGAADARPEKERPAPGDNERVDGEPADADRIEDRAQHEQRH